MRALRLLAYAMLVGCGLNTGGTELGAGADDAGPGSDAWIDSTSQVDAGSDSTSSPQDVTASDAHADVSADAPNDMTAPLPDAGTDTGMLGVPCPASPCGAGMTCCTVANAGNLTMTCEASCPGDTVGCRVPTDCPGGYCCTTLHYDNATPVCGPASASTQCSASACVDSFPWPPCAQTVRLRLCAKPSDCMTDALGQKCCTFANAPGFYACVNDTLSQYASGCL